jgi:D-lactate dehydrogenase (cytochrome)
VSEGQLVTTDVELEPYGRDWHSYHSGVPPDVVVFPTSTAQVSAVLCACNDAGFPVVARGAGTSLEGHTTTPYRGVCVDLSHMDAVVSVRPDDMDATVQAGVRWQDFNKALAPHGLFFAMDPGPGATLGGMAGTGCSGTNAVRYGAMKANVLSLTVVLADGTVVRTGSRARKSTAGYDLTSLFVGSEGTLGVVTELTVKLQHLPQQTAVAVAAFPHIRAASDAVLATMRSGVHMGAVELLDTNMIGAVNAQSGFAYPATPHVFFKFTGSPAKVADDAARVQACIRAHGGLDFQWTPDQAAQERLWEARKVALWSAGAMDTSRKVATTDVCVPLSRLPDLMAAMEERAAASPLRVYAVGHVGDGNVHHFIAFDPDDAGELREAKALNDFLVATAQGMDGTCTGEHGVGVGKVKYLEAEFGGAALDVMRSVKAALDPRGTLNPGKKLPGCAVPVAADAAAGAPHW